MLELSSLFVLNWLNPISDLTPDSGDRFPCGSSLALLDSHMSLSHLWLPPPSPVTTSTPHQPMVLMEKSIAVTLKFSHIPYKIYNN
jgi:hypothetical protein